MRITLVYRGRYHVREALDLETLAPLVRRAGHELTFVHDPDLFGVTDNVLQAPALAERLSDEAGVVERIVGSDPDAVLFSVLPSTFAWCGRVAAEVRERTGAPNVFFGLHPSLTPRRALADPGADYVVEGEIEGVALDLLGAVEGGQGFDEVGNLWRRGRDGAPQFTFRAPLVDLDALPLPDKDLFAPGVDHHYSYAAMVSRGCPFQCTFCEETCSKQLYSGRYFRRKRVDTVMRELAEGRRRYHFREVIFKDSYLSGEKAWLRELMDRYRREIRVPFKCFCTLTGFDEETARLLKKGGCYSIEFGLQTWNDRLRREVLGRRETAADAFRALAHCDRHRLWYDIDHMFNLPTETPEDHALGVACYGRLKFLGRVKVHYLVYLPGAPIVEHALAAGDLPSDAARHIEDGLETDFYDPADDGDPARRRLVAGYATLYKLLPMLPEAAVRRLHRPGRLERLGRLPKTVVALLQGLNALRCGDLRFLAYLQTYPRKVLAALARA